MENQNMIYGVGDEILVFAITVCALAVGGCFISRRFSLFGHRGVMPASAPLGSGDQEGIVPHRYTSELCPICLQPHALAVETNCGHVYCGQCIFQYHDFGSALSPMQCPFCRQQVTILFACFTAEEMLPGPETEEGQVVQNLLLRIGHYNRRFSGAPRPLLDYLRDMPTLLRHLWNEFFSIGGLMIMFRIRIILCFVVGFVYVISPLDIIPETVFGVLGFLDDAFVGFLICVYITIIYRRFVAGRDGPLE